MADDFQFDEGSGPKGRAKEVKASPRILIPYSFVATGPPRVVGKEIIDVTTGSTLTVPPGATHALVTVDAGGGDIRYWEDGTVPADIDEGLFLPGGAIAELQNLDDIAMRATTGTVRVNVSYRAYDSQP